MSEQSGILAVSSSSARTPSAKQFTAPIFYQRRPFSKSGLLIIGCGSYRSGHPKPLSLDITFGHDEYHKHTDADTIDPNEQLFPTILGAAMSIEMAQYLIGHGRKYDCIVLEGIDSRAIIRNIAVANLLSLLMTEDGGLYYKVCKSFSSTDLIADKQTLSKLSNIEILYTAAENAFERAIQRSGQKMPAKYRSIFIPTILPVKAISLPDEDRAVLSKQMAGGILELQECNLSHGERTQELIKLMGQHVKTLDELTLIDCIFNCKDCNPKLHKNNSACHQDQSSSVLPLIKAGLSLETVDIGTIEYDPILFEQIIALLKISQAQNKIQDLILIINYPIEQTNIDDLFLYCDLISYTPHLKVFEIRCEPMAHSHFERGYDSIGFNITHEEYEELWEINHDKDNFSLLIPKTEEDISKRLLAKQLSSPSFPDSLITKYIREDDDDFVIDLSGLRQQKIAEAKQNQLPKPPGQILPSSLIQQLPSSSSYVQLQSQLAHAPSDIKSTKKRKREKKEGKSNEPENLAKKPHIAQESLTSSVAGSIALPSQRLAIQVEKTASSASFSSSSPTIF